MTNIEVSLKYVQCGQLITDFQLYSGDGFTCLYRICLSGPKQKDCLSNKQRLSVEIEISFSAVSTFTLYLGIFDYNSSNALHIFYDYKVPLYSNDGMTSGMRNNNTLKYMKNYIKQGTVVAHIFNLGKYNKISNSENVHNNAKSKYAFFLNLSWDSTPLSFGTLIRLHNMKETLKRGKGFFRKERSPLILV